MKTLVLALSVLAALPASATDPAPHITDPAGDANGITFPYTPGGAVGNLERMLFPEDPTGAGVVTGDASFAPADLLSVRFETTYVSVPVGEDGIDHRATGLRIHVRTSETPRPLGPTTIYEIGSHVPGSSNGCRTFARAIFPGPLSPGGEAPPTASASVGGSGDGCQLGDVQSAPGTVKLSVSPAPPGLTLEVPQTAFPEEARWFFDEGHAIFEPLGWTSAVSFWPRIDSTVLGPEFLIGSDMPEDVPCTRGCPAN